VEAPGQLPSLLPPLNTALNNRCINVDLRKCILPCNVKMLYKAFWCPKTDSLRCIYGIPCILT